MGKSLFEEIGLDKVEEIMAKATAESARRADELGLPHAIEAEGRWMWQYPDGRLVAFDNKYDAPEEVPAKPPKCTKN
ncbi:hypothetical protein P3W53_12990 [Pseudomonas denitrificans (nom. rej.)]|nr:hypothetical protein [Pseudomonas denitrificans (nom. rej.)]